MFRRYLKQLFADVLPTPPAFPAFPPPPPPPPAPRIDFSELHLGFASLRAEIALLHGAITSLLELERRREKRSGY